MWTNWEARQHAVHPPQGTAEVPSPSIADRTSANQVPNRPAGSGSSVAGGATCS
jgi:hypothetical protein